MLDKETTIAALLDDLDEGQTLQLRVLGAMCSGLPPKHVHENALTILDIVGGTNPYEEIPDGLRTSLGFQGVWVWVTIPWAAIVVAGTSDCQVIWPPRAQPKTAAPAAPPQSPPPSSRQTKVPFLRVLDGGKAPPSSPNAA